MLKIRPELLYFSRKLPLTYHTGWNTNWPGTILDQNVRTVGVYLVNREDQTVLASVSTAFNRPPRINYPLPRPPGYFLGVRRTRQLLIKGVDRVGSCWSCGLPTFFCRNWAKSTSKKINTNNDGGRGGGVGRRGGGVFFSSLFFFGYL